jgi:hypothetical protein
MLEIGLWEILEDLKLVSTFRISRQRRIPSDVTADSAPVSTEGELWILFFISKSDIRIFFRLAHRAGLFYEDEFEVTTAASTTTANALLNDEWYEKKKASLLLLDPKYPNVGAILADKDGVAASGVVDSVPPYLLDMLREQCLLLFGSTTASRFTGEVIHHK